MTLIDDVARRALKAWIPPAKMVLSEWLESNVRLPSEVSALAGPLQLWPWQVELANAMADPGYERVTLCKGTRLGFSMLAVGAVAAYSVNDPSPILYLLPTQDDCRDFCTSELDPVFAASPVLRDALKADPGDVDRNVMLSRRFRGGFLKIIPARSPRNLRRHTARVVLLDEVDGFEVTAEGDAVKLAEQRTISYPNRKIICGSTPTYLETSAILKRYAESDRRIYECPCVHCGVFTEIKWEHIKWPEDKPEGAQFCCPACGGFADDRRKFEMVSNGRWRITKPEVQDHAGFRLNSLVSLLANASWPKLAKEFVAAKENPTDLQVFVNCTLAEGWSEGGADIDDAALSARAKAFSLEMIPAEILLITCGIDIQDDRVEATLCGWTERNEMFVLEHRVIWGSPGDTHVWREAESMLTTRWPHALGGRLGITATVIDSGDGDWTQQVYNFAFPRANRGVMAGKGVSGSRPVIEHSKTKIQGGGRLWILGVDVIKTQLFDRLQRDVGIYFSSTLPPVFFEQLAAERRVTRYFKGRPIRRFEPISGRRNEALDCVVMAIAARAPVRPNFDYLRHVLGGTQLPAPIQIDTGVATDWTGAGPNWVRDGGRR